MWRLGIMAEEALLNLRSRLGFNLGIALILSLVIGLLGWIESVEVDQILVESAEAELAGSNVFIVGPREPVDEPVVSTDVCDSLNQLPQILSAGGLTRTELLVPPVSPGTPFQTYSGSGRIVKVLDPSVSATRLSGADTVARVWLADEASRQLGYPPNATYSDGANLAEVEVFDPGLRYAVGQTMVLSVGYVPKTDECWFEVAPGQASKPTVTTVQALFKGPPEMEVVPLLSDRRNFLDLYRERSTRWLWVPGALFAFLVGALHALLARGQTALYRTLGAGRFVAACIGLAEFGIVLASSAVVGGGFGVMVSRDLLSGARGVGLATVAAVWGIGLGGVGLVHLLLSRRSTIDQLKERP